MTILYLQRLITYIHRCLQKKSWVQAQHLSTFRNIYCKQNYIPLKLKVYSFHQKSILRADNQALIYSAIKKTVIRSEV